MKIRKRKSEFGPFFIFRLDEEDNDVYKFGEKERCNYCGSILDTSYVNIIEKLKENGLLSENYKKMCCICNTMRDVTIKDYRIQYQEIGGNEFVADCSLDLIYKENFRTFKLKTIESTFIYKKLIKMAKNEKDLHNFKRLFCKLKFKLTCEKME